MRILIASVAAIAMATTVAQANPGKGNGKGNGKPAAAQQTAGPKAECGNLGRDKKAGRGQGRQIEKRAERNYERRANVEAKRNRGNARSSLVDGNDLDRERGARGNVRNSDAAQTGDRFALTPVAASRGLIDGCPPGLAKKSNACLPPGQAKKRGYFQPDYFGFGRLGEGRYFYDDGLLMRLDARDRIAGFLPLLGGALAIGNPWPDYYEPAPLPGYYAEYFNLGEQRSYRFADDVIYRVDPETAAITSIAALLTGDEFENGRRMPRGYDVYNVPYAYRDKYYDRSDAIYRYSDGYIYEIDPETMLVASAIELLI